MAAAAAALSRVSMSVCWRFAEASAYAAAADLRHSRSPRLREPVFRPSTGCGFLSIRHTCGVLSCVAQVWLFRAAPNAVSGQSHHKRQHGQVER
jgi:hypothetical protein